MPQKRKRSESPLRDLAEDILVKVVLLLVDFYQRAKLRQTSKRLRNAVHYVNGTASSEPLKLCLRIPEEFVILGKRQVEYLGELISSVHRETPVHFSVFRGRSDRNFLDDATRLCEIFVHATTTVKRHVYRSFRLGDRETHFYVWYTCASYTGRALSRRAPSRRALMPILNITKVTMRLPYLEIMRAEQCLLRIMRANTLQHLVFEGSANSIYDDLSRIILNGTFRILQRLSWRHSNMSIAAMNSLLLAFHVCAVDFSYNTVGSDSELLTILRVYVPPSTDLLVMRHSGFTLQVMRIYLTSLYDRVSVSITRRGDRKLTVVLFEEGITSEDFDNVHRETREGFDAQTCQLLEVLFSAEPTEAERALPP